MNYIETQQKTARQALIKSIQANFGLFFIKLISGIFGQSFALVADAIESLSDVVSSLLVLFGLKYASKPADKNHPYGHGKAEPIVTMIVVLFLIGSATLIIIQSIKNIGTPHESPKKFTLVILGIIIISKEILFQFMKNKASKTGSSSLLADAWHHRADAITSVAAFIGISFSIYMGKGFESADDYAALFAAIVIIFNAIKLAKPAVSEIMDENKYPDLMNQLVELTEKTPGAIEVEKCFIRKHGMTYFVDMHLVVDGNISVRDGHEIAHLVKRNIQHELPFITEMMIHIEPN